MTSKSDHQDEEEEERQEDRMARLEERLHVFELLFQAYYINDEVFRSLAHALQSDLDHRGRPREQQRNRPRAFSFIRSRTQ